MSRAANLKVRLLGGQAYDGEQYVGHAWNQVYLADENKWINVDTTFYDGGNYFDSNLFNKHDVEEIAGEW
ncbi:transglutaminase-like domain-containing protein [Clostridium sp. MF28]|nr:transglutaminase-like domain-containing protein [Clostridium sp. MF28]